MNSKVLAATLGALTVIPQFARAASDAETRQQIEKLQGDSAGFDKFFGALKESMRANNPDAFSRLVAYPLTVNTAGKSRKVTTAGAMVKEFRNIAPRNVRSAVAKQPYAGLFVNASGVMVAEGVVWMANVCDDQACKKTHWAVTAINN